MKISEELLQLIAAAGRGEVIEARLFNTDWYDVYSLDSLIINYRDGIHMRIKPKTITLAGVEFPEPLRVAPEIDAYVWVAVATNPGHPSRCVWTDSTASDLRFWLKLGLLQATEQGAKDQARAMILSVGGSLE